MIPIKTKGLKKFWGMVLFRFLQEKEMLIYLKSPMYLIMINNGLDIKIKRKNSLLSISN